MNNSVRKSSQQLAGAVQDLRRSAGQLRRDINRESLRISDAASTAAQETVINGRFGVNNTGEAKKLILFPVDFTTLPSFTFGFEIGSESEIVDTRAPVITAEVFDWLTIEDLPTAIRYYGAQILVVSTGANIAKFTVVWSARGVAYSGY